MGVAISDNRNHFADSHCCHHSDSQGKINKIFYLKINNEYILGEIAYIMC